MRSLTDITDVGAKTARLKWEWAGTKELLKSFDGIKMYIAWNGHQVWLYLIRPRTQPQDLIMKYQSSHNIFKTNESTTNNIIAHWNTNSVKRRKNLRNNLIICQIAIM